MEKIKKPNAFDFLSTREFAVAVEQWAVKAFPGYSRRAFAKWAGIASPNFMSLVVEGKRSLRGQWLDGFGKAALLPTDQLEHLQALGRFEGAKSPARRNELLEKIHRDLANLNSHSLAGDQLEVLSHPLAWTLLQMLDFKDQTSNPGWFKRRLRASVSAALVADALFLLKRVGLVRMKNGKIQALQNTFKSSDQVRKSTNVIYHKNVLGEAAEMLDLLEPSERAFGSFTATVSHEKIDALKREINKFGEYLLNTYASRGPTDGEVMRLNIQLYTYLI
ncbi:MAG TPA: TIGR02147 family protein [Bdellovibrionales bacterium]|nr:TIGR02147 family protein [Bdellovibrionales bacterium]